MTTVPDIDELSARISGHRFPGGEVVFRSHEVWLGNDAMAAPGGSGAMNPLWFLLAALRGMGVTIGELVEIADTDMSEGVLFGEMQLQQDSPLVADERYTVSGGIESIIRREGRSGSFDVLEFALDIAGLDGERRGRVTSSFVLQRRQS